MFHFPGVQAPRTPNFNPADDELQAGKPAWIRDLPMMNDSVIGVVDASFRARLQGLQGVDEIVEDVVAMLERKGVLEETYSRFPSTLYSRQMTLTLIRCSHIHHR